MNQRFKLTQDGTIHINNGNDSYTDTLENAVLDMAVAGLNIPAPDLQGASGLVAVAGFEVSATRMEFILENGWHYPIPESAYSQYQLYLDAITNLPAILSAKTTRMALDAETSGNE